jgi:uncharacterized membrane protein
MEELVKYILPIIILVVFSAGGLILYLFPPKKINGIYGYRTPRSMKNQSNWNYAQKLGGKYMMIFAVVISITQMILGYAITSLNNNLDYIMPFQLITMIVLMIIMLVICEMKLKAFENKVNSR